MPSIYAKIHKKILKLRGKMKVLESIERVRANPARVTILTQRARASSLNDVLLVVLHPPLSKKKLSDRHRHVSSAHYPAHLFAHSCPELEALSTGEADELDEQLRKGEGNSSKGAGGRSRGCPEGAGESPGSDGGCTKGACKGS